MARILALIVGLLISVPIAASAQGIEEYLLQPGDVIDVSVLEDPNLNQRVLIRPDGRISLPLAGTFDVEGLTPEAVALQIRSALARDFVQPPTVTVALTSTVGLRREPTVFFMLGQIGRPGRYQSEREIDLIQALALAGGPGQFANLDSIQIRRRTGEGESVIFFNFELLEQGAVPASPPIMRDGDVVFVPERGLFD